MNIVTQEARKKQAVVKYAEKNGKSSASRMYGISLSSVKRWCKRYDGTWRSMVEKSHRPHSHPNRHTPKEERQIKNSFKKEYARYGWEFLFIGANIDAVETAARYGIDRDRAVNYNADRKGTQVVYESVSRAVCQVRKCEKISADWSSEIDKDYRKRNKKNI